MKNKNIISVDQICRHYNIDPSFIHELIEHGLTQITIIEQTSYIHQDHLKDVERMIRMHYDLNINLEGIDVIFNLLHRLDRMHEEMTLLKNQLEFYE